MMTTLSYKVIQTFRGRTISTAESCTGGGIGSALTAIPGSSIVYKGGIISYTNEVKTKLLGVPKDLLDREGPVSAPVAREMANGIRNSIQTDVAISVTGLAGPGGDAYGNPVGTVYIGYCDAFKTIVQQFHFEGNREQVRRQAITAALEILLRHA